MEYQVLQYIYLYFQDEVESNLNKSYRMTKYCKTYLMTCISCALRCQKIEYDKQTH